MLAKMGIITIFRWSHNAEKFVGVFTIFKTLRKRRTELFGFILFEKFGFMERYYIKNFEPMIPFFSRTHGRKKYFSDFSTCVITST